MKAKCGGQPETLELGRLAPRVARTGREAHG